MRSGKDSKTALIAGVPLFSACSKSELASVAAVADELDLDAGATLIREGERGREFIVIAEGDVDVTRAGEVISQLGPGSFVGEISLVADIPRTATVVARTPVRTLVITDRAFKKLIEESPSVAGKVLQAIGERLHEASSAA